MNAWGYIGAGLCAVVLGGFLFAVATAGETIDWMLLLELAALALGGVLVLIGGVAEGVRIGNRDSR